MEPIYKIIPDYYDICPVSYNELEKALPKKDTCFNGNKKELICEVEKIISQKIKDNKKTSSPFILHTAGIPGAGKSYYSSKLIKEDKNFKDIVYIQFDEIMQNLKAYKNDLEFLTSKNGEDKAIKKAFENWEIPARIIGYEILQRAINNKKSILLDHSASFRGHINLLEYMKKNGYKIEMHFFDISIEKAKERVLKRQEKTKRHTPVEMLTIRRNKLIEMIEDYKKISDIFINHKQD